MKPQMPRWGSCDLKGSTNSLQDLESAGNGVNARLHPSCCWLSPQEAVTCAEVFLSFACCPTSRYHHNPSMAKNPELNRAHQKAWYERTRGNEILWRAYLDKKLARRRAKRANSKDGLGQAGLGHGGAPPRLAEQGLQKLPEEQAAVVERDGGLGKQQAEAVSLQWLIEEFTDSDTPEAIESRSLPPSESPF